MTHMKGYAAGMSPGSISTGPGRDVPQTREVTAVNYLEDIEGLLFKAGLLAGRIQGVVSGAGAVVAGAELKSADVPSLMQRLHACRELLTRHVAELRDSASQLGVGVGDIEA